MTRNGDAFGCGIDHCHLVPWTALELGKTFLRWELKGSKRKFVGVTSVQHYINIAIIFILINCVFNINILYLYSLIVCTNSFQS